MLHDKKDAAHPAGLFDGGDDSSAAEDDDGIPRERRQGVYGWVQKDAEDWRVIWLGDAREDDDGDFADDE